MNVKSGLKLRKVGASYMLVDVSKSHPDITDIYTLNETAALIWSCVSERNSEPSEIAERICQEYDIDRDSAVNDVNAIIESWKESGLISD